MNRIATRKRARAKHLGQVVYSEFAMAKIIRDELEGAGAAFKGAGIQRDVYAAVADEAGLSATTVRKLATGETQFPRATTLIVLFEYFGFDIEAVRGDVRRSIIW